jgi:phage baseplate assembly protein W
VSAHIDFPFSFDVRGRAATTGADDHVRDLIHQVLFTNPGERVNRPDFGCGLLQLVFMPNSDVLATATQFTVTAALQRWLADVVDVEEVRIANLDEQLHVDVRYTRRDDGTRREDRFAAPRIA